MIKICAICGTQTDEETDGFMNICENGCADKIRDRWQCAIDRMGELYSNYRFDTFEVTQNNISAHTACVKFANTKTITENLPSAICLSSKSPGNGKTHLGVSTVRQWLTYTKPAVKFPVDPYSISWSITSDAKILQDVRKTYNDNAVDDEDDVIARYGGYPILMIDDLGKYKPEKLNFLQRILFEIVNIRYVKRSPTILTTNLTNEELQDYIGDYSYDRILGMIRYTDKNGKAVHPIYELKGESRR